MSKRKYENSREKTWQREVSSQQVSRMTMVDSIIAINMQAISLLRDQDPEYIKTLKERVLRENQQFQEENLGPTPNINENPFTPQSNQKKSRIKNVSHDYEHFIFKCNLDSLFQSTSVEPAPASITPDSESEVAGLEEYFTV